MASSSCTSTRRQTATLRDSVRIGRAESAWRQVGASRSNFGDERYENAQMQVGQVQQPVCRALQSCARPTSAPNSGISVSAAMSTGEMLMGRETSRPLCRFRV